MRITDSTYVGGVTLYTRAQFDQLQEVRPFPDLAQFHEVNGACSTFATTTRM